MWCDTLSYDFSIERNRTHRRIQLVLAHSTWLVLFVPMLRCGNEIEMQTWIKSNGFFLYEVNVNSEYSLWKSANKTVVENRIRVYTFLDFALFLDLSYVPIVFKLDFLLLSCNVKCLFFLKFTLDSDFAQIVFHLLHNCAIIVRTFWQNPNFIHRN